MTKLAIVLLVLALCGLAFCACAPMPAQPTVAPPTPAQPEDDAGVVFPGDAGLDPGCHALCARCPGVAPPGEDCDRACTMTLDAVDGMLDPQCVADAASCDEAERCVR